MLPKKILLAEDDADDQLLFHEYLHQRNDIELLPVADNGVALLDLLEATSNAALLPDLIILDQNMPKKNGVQTLKDLKENHRYAHIPVMVYSTYTDQQLVAACLQSGALAVLPKPLTKDGYHAMMDAFLKAAV